MNLQITPHAIKRAHQRFALKRRAAHRSAERALELGHVVTGNQYDDPWVLGNQPTMTSCREIRAYGNAYYVFEYSRAAVSLITITKKK
jgi:hypothetical protein